MTLRRVDDRNIRDCRFLARALPLVIAHAAPLARSETGPYSRRLTDR